MAKKKDKMTREEMLAQQEMLANIINYFTDGNKAQFARILERNPQDINSWFYRGIWAPVKEIYRHFPTVNPEYLLSNGKGEMLRPEEQPQTVAANGTMSAASLTGPATVNVAVPESEIAILQERVALLERLLDEKERAIQILMSQTHLQAAK